MSQIVSVVEESTINGQNLSFVVEKDKSNFSYYTWNEYFSQFFSVIPNITSYHHFAFSSEHPGEVLLRNFCDDSSVTFKFLKVAPDRGSLPSTLHAEGLSNTRKQYLYDEIRQFCEDEEEYKDITCPLPMSAKKRSQEAPSQKSAKRSKSGFSALSPGQPHGVGAKAKPA